MRLPPNLYGPSHAKKRRDDELRRKQEVAGHELKEGYRTTLLLRPDRWQVLLAFAGAIAMVLPFVLLAAVTATGTQTVNPEPEAEAAHEVRQQEYLDAKHHEADHPLDLNLHSLRGSDVALAQACLRPVDPICRWGGREITPIQAQTVLRVLDGEPQLLNPIPPESAALTAARASLMAIQNAPSAQDRSPLHYVITMLFTALFAVLLLLLSATGWRLGRTLKVEVHRHQVRLGHQTVATSQIAGCRLEEQRIVLRLLGGGQVRSACLDLNEQAEELLAMIQSVMLSPEERIREARAKLAVQKMHVELQRQIAGEG